ncbi:DNA-binding, integrase-type [Cynara cardunculus var. scolymus]|uniref:DNA-binding, integrase-type n=1 Tax=Cynara cardunculus var. scolymus TaxID=59895 RepID=A0A118K4B3_CYNCS|nr:DNA-binding, integrase-type [Cynara cardunculus var. scolymus]
MATTTTTTTVDPDRPPPLRLDSIPTVDLRLLSQSELYSLSKCSNSSFDLNRCDDVVIPKIDRSVFNESAGSRKQTYSRLRLAPAESSTSAKTTMHRRTSHIRSPHAPTSNNINDPEQAENTQIVRMLKELFNSDPNFEDLVPIEVQNDTNVVVPELLKPEMKRKRGRPRKHENAAFIHPPAAKRMRDIMVKKVVVFDNDRDREIVNSRGVKVNIANLGRLEDPYGPEIRRRTEGMLTEGELLGFLGGLDGQWGTSRKKKRIVDASDFGDALPKGWRLSLSIKKKAGRVWLFCRRYISPSGRQFESCKEASMYLLSIVGEEKLDKPNQTHSNNCDDFALKGASGNAADLFVREDLKRISSVQNPSALPTSLHTDSGKQVMPGNLDPVVEQVEELFKCLKCFMIFEGKMGLLNHQVLFHKYERSDIGSAVSDCTVVKGGIFECQLCHKTFLERSQYNGHIGMHVTNESRTAEASEAPTAEKTNDPVLYPGVPDKELPASVSAEGNVVIETHDAHHGDKIISASPQSDHKLSSGTELKTNEHFRDLNILAHGNQEGHVNMNGVVLVEKSGDEIGKNCNVDDNEVPGTDKAPVVSVSKSDLCFDYEPSMSAYESSRKFESSGGIVDRVDDKTECDLDQGTSSGGCLLSPFSSKQLGSASAVVEKDGVSNGQDAVSGNGVTHVDKPECILKQGRSSGNSPPYINEPIGSSGGVGKIVIGEYASVEVLNHAVSETGVPTSSIGGKKGFRANINDTNICSSLDKLTPEKEKVVNSESSSGVFHGVGLNEDCVVEMEKLSGSESLSLVSPSSAVNNASLISSKKQESPREVGFAGSIIAASVDQVTHASDENRFSYGIASSKLDGQYEVRSSAFASYNVSSMYGGTCMEKERNFISRSSVSSWCKKECMNEDVGSKVLVSTMKEPQTQMSKENFHMENDVNNASSNKSGEANLDDFQIFRNDESKDNEVASLGSSQNGLNAGVMAFNTGKNLEFCSLAPPENEQAFGFQDDVSGLYDNAHGSSERGLLDHFCVAETSDDIFGNKMYSTPLDGLKFGEERNIGIHELSLAFGNPHALYADTISVEQKKGVNCSVVPSKIEDAFDVQTNLSMVNNSMVEDLKGVRESVGGSFSLSCNNEARAFQHNGNTVFSGRTWEDLGSDEFRSSERKKFMIGSSSNQRQLNEAEDGLFRLDERYKDGSSVGGLRSGRSEPLEFRFLTGQSEHNPHALQGDSRVFPYNTGMEQAFDSPFWMGKNSMMPNMARNLVTGLCSWCRNEFHFHPQTQAGIGSLCPACSAGISGQVNML